MAPTPLASLPGLWGSREPPGNRTLPGGGGNGESRFRIGERQSGDGYVGGSHLAERATSSPKGESSSISSTV
jgi:hypothetical protein